MIELSVDDRIDFEAFHVSLTEHLAEANPLLIAPVGSSICFSLADDRAVTYRQTDAGVTVEDGSQANCVMVLDESAWQLFASQYLGIIGLAMTNRIEFTAGGFGEFIGWDAALKHLYFDHPIYQPPPQPFDPPRAFSLNDTDAEMTEALATYGFVLIKSVFTPEEVATMQADVESAKAAATPDDGKSWWATLGAGDEVCCRVNYLSDQSAFIDSLTTDQRILRVGALSGNPLVCCDRNSDGHSVVIKYHDVDQGLADLPWHTDCGNGGHDLLCPMMNLGIQLDAASEATGQVHYLPGSTGTAVIGSRPRRDWQTFAIDTEPGDLTVHMGHTWHYAPPPTEPGPGRRAIYMSFHRSELSERLGPYQAYNDVLFAEGSGRIRVDM